MRFYKYNEFVHSYGPYFIGRTLRQCRAEARFRAETSTEDAHSYLSVHLPPKFYLISVKGLSHLIPLHKRISSFWKQHPLVIPGPFSPYPSSSRAAAPGTQARCRAHVLLQDHPVCRGHKLTALVWTLFLD